MGKVLCACGCGRQVLDALYSDASKGWVAGQPRSKFLHGHNTTRPVPSRLRAYSRKRASGCLEWTGTLSPAGYGMLSVEGFPRLAHRLAWAQAKGPIPAGMCVCHRCDNRKCLRVAHLFLGDTKANMQDMARKGRAGITAKLTPRRVRAIKRALAAGATGRSLAVRFAVSDMAISAIKTGRSWKRVAA